MFNFVSNIESCYIDVPHLLYYSHIPTAIVALLLGFFVFANNKKSFPGKLLLAISILFSFWSLADIIIWVSPDSRFVMFFWSIVNLLEILVSVATLYFAYAFISKKQPAVWVKAVFAAILASFSVAIATQLNLTGFDIYNCEALQGPLTNYFYAIEIFNFACLIGYLGYSIFKTSGEERKQVALFSTGTILFLLSFSGANLIGSFLALANPNATDNWKILQYGLFGMPVMIGFLSYLIVKFKTFNIKLAGAQALVFAIIALVGSEFFFVSTLNNKVLVAITFLLVCIGGYYLVKSVKNEIRAKEDLQVANGHLEELNRQKSEFVSFASHQLRSPLTSIKGNASMMLEGDFGALTEQMKGVVDVILKSVSTQISVVEDYLNVSRIELGTMKYNLIPMDFKDLLRDIVNEQKANIDAKGLKFALNIDATKTYKIKADPDKFKQVIMNLIDNSIKYTPKGSLDISLSKDMERGMIRFKVSDTGVGINPAVMPKLFQKFSRAENANEANIHGTGLGLFLAKDIVKAHDGKVWAESEGEGKGSQFYVEVPEIK